MLRHVPCCRCAGPGRGRRGGRSRAGAPPRPEPRAEAAPGSRRARRGMPQPCSCRRRPTRWSPSACSSSIGSVDDPAGKEGLAGADRGHDRAGAARKTRTYAEVLDALYPLAAHIRVYGDKESIVFEGTVHRDNLARVRRSAGRADPGARASPTTTSRATARTRSTTSPRPCAGTTTRIWASRRWRRSCTRGHPYGHPRRARSPGWRPSRSTTCKLFYALALHARPPDRRRRRAAIPTGFAEAFARALRGAARQGAAVAASCRRRRCTEGNQVLIVEKDARANAISIGSPIAITRARSRLLSVDRRAVVPGRAPHVQRRADEPPARRPRAELRRLRVHRELHPGRLVDLPAPNIPRRQQHFELWLRPVPPQNACSRCAARCTRRDQLIRDGIPAGRVSSRPRRSW